MIIMIRNSSIVQPRSAQHFLDPLHAEGRTELEAPQERMLRFRASVCLRNNEPRLGCVGVTCGRQQTGDNRSLENIDMGAYRTCCIIRRQLRSLAASSVRAYRV